MRTILPNYNRIGLKRLLFKYEQVVEKVLRCNPELGSESPNIMILLDAETNSVWHSASFMSFWTVREHFIIWCGQVVLDKRLESEKNITCNFWCFRGFETVGVKWRFKRLGRRQRSWGWKIPLGYQKESWFGESRRLKGILTVLERLRIIAINSNVVSETIVSDSLRIDSWGCAQRLIHPDQKIN